MAHVDTLGAVVAEIKSNGRLRLSPVGGFNANNAEAHNCRVYTYDGQIYEGTIQLADASFMLIRNIPQLSVHSSQLRLS